MTPQTDLEIKGSFYAHPFAELITEIAQAKLDGSLRVSHKEKKCVFYFKAGRVAFAVSNARTSRLFDILLRQNKMTKEELGQIPNFANDLEFAAYLKDHNVLNNSECDRLFTEQIEGIISDVLAWPAGDWTFSSLARVRDGLAFEINTTGLLIDFVRWMPVENVLLRFRSLDESFTRSGLTEMGVGLKPDEAFVLSRAVDGELTAAGLVSVAAMEESTAIHAIYTLWLAGLLIRTDWQPAFSGATVKAMKGARLERKIEARQREVPVPVVEEKAPETPSEPAQKASEAVISVDEYLERVEKAETHYDILGVDSKAEIDELKRAYFGLAKMFHPDRYHAEGGETLKRIQHAFTELAQAHETLKNTESREIYDYRMRKELGNRDARDPQGDNGNDAGQIEQATAQFERGYSLLMDDEYDDAIPFLARAVHFAPKNAQYHAYYGKALASDAKQRHKAEAEMQTALRLNPNNPAFRIILAEFFIQYNLLKRAEGELTRLLALNPDNREALDLLNGLRS